MTGTERAFENINKLVEFCNSKETNTTFGGSSMIIHQNIQRVLIRKFDYFSTYNFANGEEAKRMFNKIGATDRGWGENQNRLTTKDIVKIMYRGKVIYQREES